MMRDEIQRTANGRGLNLFLVGAFGGELGDDGQIFQSRGVAGNATTLQRWPAC